MFRKFVSTVLVTLATLCTIWLGPAPARLAYAEMINSVSSEGDYIAARLVRDKEIVRANLQAMGMSPAESAKIVEQLNPLEVQTVAAMPDQLRTAGVYEGAVVVGLVLLWLFFLYICAREEDPMTRRLETPQEAELKKVRVPSSR